MYFCFTIVVHISKYISDGKNIFSKTLCRQQNENFDKIIKMLNERLWNSENEQQSSFSNLYKF